MSATLAKLPSGEYSSLLVISNKWKWKFSWGKSGKCSLHRHSRYLYVLNQLHLFNGYHCSSLCTRHLLHCTAELFPRLLWGGDPTKGCFLISHSVPLVSIEDKDHHWPSRIAFFIRLVQCTLLTTSGWCSVAHTWWIHMIVEFNLFWKPLLWVIKKTLAFWISSQMERFWTWRHF